MAISQRTLYGISGGLSAQPTQPGFLGGLFSGLSGSLGGFSRYTDMTHEQERQRMMDMLAERRVRLEEARLEEERAYHKALLTRPARGSSSSASYAPVIYGATDPEGDVQPVNVGQYFGVSTPALKKELDRQAVSSLFPKQQKTKPPTQQDITASAVAKNLGITPEEARTFSKTELAPSGTRIVTGRQQFDPMKAAFAPAPPETIQTFPSERVQTLRDLAQATDSTIVARVAREHADPIVRAAARRRLSALMLGGR